MKIKGRGFRGVKGSRVHIKNLKKRGQIYFSSRRGARGHSTFSDVPTIGPKHDVNTMCAIKTARLPTIPPNSGALTKKPLPMIDASGVTVACQLDEFDNRLEIAK